MGAGIARLLSSMGTASRWQRRVSRGAACTRDRRCSCRDCRELLLELAREWDRTRVSIALGSWLGWGGAWGSGAGVEGGGRLVDWAEGGR